VAPLWGTGVHTHFLCIARTPLGADNWKKLALAQVDSWQIRRFGKCLISNDFKNEFLKRRGNWKRGWGEARTGDFIGEFERAVPRHGNGGHFGG